MSLFGAQSIFVTAATTEEALERAKELDRRNTIADGAASLSTAAPLTESIPMPMTFKTWKLLFLQHAENTALLSNGQLLLPTVLSYLGQLKQDFAEDKYFTTTGGVRVTRGSYKTNPNFCENWAAVKFPDAAQIKNGVPPEALQRAKELNSNRERLPASDETKKSETKTSTSAESLSAEELSTEDEKQESGSRPRWTTRGLDSAPPTSSELARGQTIVVDGAPTSCFSTSAAPLAESAPMTFETCWKQSKAGRAWRTSRTAGEVIPDAPAVSFKTAALRKKDELRGLFEGIRDCAAVYPKRLADIAESESVMAEECSELLADTEHMATLLKSARDLLHGFVLDLRESHREQLLQEELFSDDICGRIRDAGARYQALAREFRQVSSQEGGLLVKTKNALETDLRLLRKSLVRTWGKLCETHKFPTSTRNLDQQDDTPAGSRGLDANAAADEFQSVLDDVVPRVTALRLQFEGSIRSGGSSGAQCSSNELDLPVLERETLLVASQLRKLECLSDSMDALRLNVVVTAPNGEVICERDATLYASSGTRLTIGALTNSIRDDINASVKNFLRIRDADPMEIMEIGIRKVQRAIHETSLSFDSTYSGPSVVGRTGLLELGFLSKGPDVFENVVFSEAVMSDIGPGRLSLVCKMHAFGRDGMTAKSSIVFFSEKDEKFYQFPLQCDNISRSTERTNTLLHTISDSDRWHSALSSLIGGDGGTTDSRGKDNRGNGGVIDAKGTVVPTGDAVGSNRSVGIFGSGISIFSQVPKNRAFGGFSGVSHPTWFQFSDESICAVAYSAVEAFHGKLPLLTLLYKLHARPDGPKQRWDYLTIAAITRGRVTEAVIHDKMETSAELPKIGEFLKSFTTDTIDLGRIKIVPYGAGDLFDDETAVLDVLRQQDRDDMELEVRGFIFSSRNAGAHSAE